MGNQYKRMVTLGMVSFTVLLAWFYCLIAYHSQILYMAIITVILIISMYAFLLAVAAVKTTKENLMREYVASTLREYGKNENIEAFGEMERLAKASYVQQRKTNTYLSAQNEQTETAWKKAVKLLIKYDQKKENEAAERAAVLEATNNSPDYTVRMIEECEKLSGDVKAIVENLQDVTEQIAILRSSVEAIELPKYVEAPVLQQEASVTAEENGTVGIMERELVMEETAITESDAALDEDTIMESDVALDEDTIMESDVALDEDTIMESDVALDEDTILKNGFEMEEDAFAESESAMEDTETFDTENFFAQFEETPVEKKEEPEDANRPMTPEEIAALIASMQ